MKHRRYSRGARTPPQDCSAALATPGVLRHNPQLAYHGATPGACGPPGVFSADDRGSGWVPVGFADFKSVGPGPSVGAVGSTPSRSRHPCKRTPPAGALRPPRPTVTPLPPDAG